MQFKIGAFTYEVVRHWDLRLDGERVDGYAASTVRQILLDGDLPENMLIDTLRHEHSHAWEFEVGQPENPESLARFNTTVGAAFDADFRQQGGLDALKELPIKGLPPVRNKQVTVSALGAVDRVWCGWCEAQVMSGSIHTSAPEVDEATATTMVRRGFLCPVCDRIQVWSERATDGGRPMGGYHDARLLRGREAEEWIRAHQELHSPYNVA